MKDKDILDWEDLSPDDQKRAEELLLELNTMFSKYDNKDEPVEEVLPDQI